MTPSAPPGPASSRRARLVAPVVALALVLVACAGGEPDAACPRVDLAAVPSSVRLCAPEDRLPAPVDASFPLVGEEGSLALADLGDKIIVVNFWGEWCGPCRVEQPELNSAHEARAGDDVDFLGVAIQASEINQQAFRDEFAVPYPSLYDKPSAYAALFGPAAPLTTPTTLVIDRAGNVAFRLSGGVTEVGLIQLIDLLLAEGPPS